MAALNVNNTLCGQYGLWGLCPAALCAHTDVLFAATLCQAVPSIHGG